MKNIIILDNNLYIRNRIKNILAKDDIVIHETDSSRNFFASVSKIKNDVSLVITELNLDDEDGFEVIDKFKKINQIAPVMILTSESSRMAFIKGINKGAVDYLLKPFEDQILLNKVMKHIGYNDNCDKNQVIINFQNYFTGELNKAKKGKYKISIIMSTFLKFNKGYDIKLEYEYLNLSNTIYNNFKTIFFDTDLLFKYGAQSFIGILPFCDENNIKLVFNKLDHEFNLLKLKNKEFSDYYLENSFVTFPLDGDDKEVLLERLTSRMNTGIKEKYNVLKGNED